MTFPGMSALELRSRAAAALSDPEQAIVHPSIARDLSILIGHSGGDLNSPSTRLAVTILDTYHQQTFETTTEEPPQQ